MAPLVKICGVTDPASVESAVRHGAAFVGFMFFAPSPRNVRPETAARLAEGLSASGVRSVAVMVDPTDAELDHVVGALRPDLVQLHGREPPARVREIRSRSGRPVVKAVAGATAEELRRGRAAYEEVADHLLYEAKAPEEASRPGGNGRSLAQDLYAELGGARPWFLAGGLTPWNVAERATLSGAPMLDVSTGVERGPGVKDPALISAFLSAARRV